MPLLRGPYKICAWLTALDRFLSKTTTTTKTKKYVYHNPCHNFYDKQQNLITDRWTVACHRFLYLDIIFFRLFVQFNSLTKILSFVRRVSGKCWVCTWPNCITNPLTDDGFCLFGTSIRGLSPPASCTVISFFFLVFFCWISLNSMKYTDHILIILKQISKIEYLILYYCVSHTI